MGTSLNLRCQCGAVQGVANDLSPSSGQHIVCYCKDCQAFARFLERDDLLDDAGGSEIYQLTPSQIDITKGIDRVRSMRLSEKGMVRWYTDCCKTPIANTTSIPKMPFAGMLVAFVDPSVETSVREKVLGRVILRSVTECATRPVPPGDYATQVVALVPRILPFLARGFLGRKDQPSPFFAPKAKTPRVAPRVLTAGERAALPHT